MVRHDPQMLKGVLGLLLLALLREEDGYGYAIVVRLQDGGFPDLLEGTVYPALTRLEAAGHLESYLRRSDSGPARKYYRITDSGRTELRRAERAWDDLAAAVAAIRAGATMPVPRPDAGRPPADPPTPTRSALREA